MDPSQKCTDILYFIPEDNERVGCQDQSPSYYDDSKDPVQTNYNIFTIPNKSMEEVTLVDVKKWFPLPGDYHFRFQFVYEKNILCWLDINNKNCKLP